MAKAYDPPEKLAREEIVELSRSGLARTDIPMTVTEHITRVSVANYAWDVAAVTYQPEDPGRIVRDADGKRAGLFLLHGGSHDFRSLDGIARHLAGKYGYKVVSMTYPGQVNFDAPDRSWPGETIYDDRTARTPIWTRDSRVGPDEYELIADKSQPDLRARHGTMYFLRAREGSEFYYRLAAAPMAYEAALTEVITEAFPAVEYSVYLHGHSTGGPQVHYMLQRIPNAAGLIGIESSPFGEVFAQMLSYRWRFDFNYMTVRTWRDIARYRGKELTEAELRNLPLAIESVFEDWDAVKNRPNIKFQDLVQFAADEQLAAAARVTATRLGYSAAQTGELVATYLSYPRPLSGPGVKPVPPLLYGITIGSADHLPDRYYNILLPYLSRLTPAPKAHVVRYETGVHSYWAAEADLPLGPGGAATEIWHRAITSGYYTAS